MTATVRLDKSLEDKLDFISKTLHKKKSDIIRDAITYYADSIQNNNKSRILKAVAKTKDADKAENAEFEGTIDDGL
ncbi:MAG: CopG family transcriptional regulator [Sulfuricurvum sp.]|nr:CopG family transcriptional regulator [Sulfuricurvum sp.]